MKAFSFNYLLTDRHTLCPLFLSVHARNLRKATKAARRKLDCIVRAERAAYWEWQGDGWDSPTMRAVYVPYHFLRGILYSGSEIKSVSRRERKAQLERSRLMSTPESMEALASALSAPIVQVIEAAPVLLNLFSEPLPLLPAYSIPLIWTTPMTREQWPTAHRSRHRDCA